MNKNRNSKLQITAWRIIQVSLIVLTILGIVKSVFVSLDMDESYAIAQAYRLVTGDKLIYDMWEPHQFSAFLPAVFLLPLFGISLLAAAIPTAVLSVVDAGKKKSSGEKKNADWLIILLAISTVLLSMRALFGYVFGDENQFTMQVRYVPFAILLLLVLIRDYRVCRREFWYGILPGVLAFPACWFFRIWV